MIREDSINDAWTHFNLYGSLEIDKLEAATSCGSGLLPENKDVNSSDSSSSVLHVASTEIAPTPSSLCISTKTKISFLNTDNIDISSLFWNVPILPYYLPGEGIIKKQIKLSSHNPTETEDIDYELSQVRSRNEYCEETIIDNINIVDEVTPGASNKYKMSRKVSIGLCKKSIANQTNKQKRAFFNCIVLILRIHMEREVVPYKEIHVKIFNTGKMEIPGIQNDDMYHGVIDLIIRTLRECGVMGNKGETLTCFNEKSETVLINSNFNCGFYINRDEMYSLLKYKYRMHCNFDSCSYPGIQSKFYYDTTLGDSQTQTGVLPKHKNYLEISFMIFRTGSVLIVGKCESNILFEIYEIIKRILVEEYKKVCNSDIQSCDKFVKKEKVVKYKTSYIYIEKSIEEE